MEIIVIIVIVIIFIANQIEKNKKNNSQLGAKGASNVVSQPNNSYQVNQQKLLEKVALTRQAI